MESFDVAVVGARAGGAATAMLLARQGLRVLLADRDRYGADTLSTHALMRGGVLLLSRWGLLDRIVAAGTPPVRQTRFHYGDETATVSIRPRLGVEALYAPRRSLLDALLVDAAAAAGAEVRFGVTVTGLLREDSGRVAGVTGHDRRGTRVSVRARLTVGADGRRSTVARAAGARTLRTGTGAGAVVYGYWTGLETSGYEWFYRPGHTAGMIPTNDGQVCVFAGMPAALFRATAGEQGAAGTSGGGTSGARTGGGLGGRYHRMLAAATKGAGGRLAAAGPPLRLRTWVGRPSFVREAQGPGWALVGDAGSFLDPLSSHGITDALRDAERLAREVAAAGGPGSLSGTYAADRDRVIGPIYDAVDRIAAYGWDLNQVRRHLLELNSAMSAEVEMISAVGAG
ncbi:NAD(P)/FAD-dependent oxidoreductase [Microbispora triticiradicis]|uniref:NAD(P)/FAD-dependent oxidoreductase n=1 Tax=Microbispora triticiradicis TaxID=2200763 RepID=A0ABX9LCR0_9ACTN|nr:FAD-dependent monooxygenase [Microbispora triticiradicis]RGA00959.1 NAD(P)/FAD-dependent oxidoreductase [Microbispora triticiradicis]